MSDDDLSDVTGPNSGSSSGGTESTPSDFVVIPEVTASESSFEAVPSTPSVSASELCDWFPADDSVPSGSQGHSEASQCTSADEESLDRLQKLSLNDQRKGSSTTEESIHEEEAPSAAPESRNNDIHDEVQQNPSLEDRPESPEQSSTIFAPNKWKDFEEEKPSCTMGHPLSSMLQPTTQWTQEKWKKITIKYDFYELPDVTEIGYSKTGNYKWIFNQELHPIETVHIYNVTRMQEVLRLRAHATQVYGHYSLRADKKFTDTSDVAMDKTTLRTAVKPSWRDKGLPCLYQVVGITGPNSLLLEAKNLEVYYQYPQLRFILVDDFGVNVASGKRAMFHGAVAIKDLIWVYSLDIWPQALYVGVEKAWNRCTAHPSSSVDGISPFFRVSEYQLVPPLSTDRGTLLYSHKEMGTGKCQVVVEKGKNVVTVGCAQYGAGHKPVFLGANQIALCIPRMNIPSGMRVSSLPTSKTSFFALKEIAADYLPRIAGASPQPLSIWPLDSEIKAIIDDRLRTFKLYKRNIVDGRGLLAETMSLGVSALAAIEKSTEDRKVHYVTMHRDDPDSILFRFEMYGKASEDGWTSGRGIAVSFTEICDACNAEIVSTTLDPAAGTFKVQARLLLSSGRRAFPHLGYSTPAFVCLLDIPHGVNPLLQMTQKHCIKQIEEKGLASGLNEVYQGQDGQIDSIRVPVSNFNSPIPYTVPSFFHRQGKITRLTEDQLLAVTLTLSPKFVTAVQAPFGAGKTTTASVAAGTFLNSNPGKRIILTATTNSAVSNFVMNMMGIDEYSELKPLRYLAKKGRGESTPYDHDELIMELCSDPPPDMEMDDWLLCQQFKQYQDHIQEKREEGTYEIFADQRTIVFRDVEEEEEMLNMLFKYYKPDVIAMTTSSLLNKWTDGAGAFQANLNTKGEVGLVLLDEGTLSPEPFLGALASVLPNVRLCVYGDSQQLVPHSRLFRDAWPNRLGNRSILGVLLHSSKIPRVVLTYTFRSHPAITRLANNLFYEERLHTMIAPEDRSALLDTREFNLFNRHIPIELVPVRGVMSKAVSRSLYNTSELEVAVGIVRRLLKYFDPSDIGVLFMYKDQMHRGKMILQEKMEVPCLTVDSCQGKEWEVTLVLTTRTEPSKKGSPLDFFSCRRRACVALTRAKQGMFILGSESALETIDLWKDVVRELRSIQQHGF